MVVTEIDSFIHKFHQLWRDGLTAHLDLDTHAGNAWVGLRVQLSHQVPRLIIIIQYTLIRVIPLVNADVPGVSL